MRYHTLGTSSLQVSELSLGTMTFGQQNSEAEAHAQLTYALDQGINLIDTAEMYPVPARAETQGLTETYVGTWLAQQPRDRILIATKVAGPSRGMTWLRGQTRAVNRANITQAIEGSLRRLQTDYIDLYQIHWPERYVPLFGESVYQCDRIRPEAVPMAEQLVVFADLIQAGKIRHWGLSNETPWGMATFTQLATQLHLPAPISIQNAYNLLNRVFETSHAEASLQAQMPLLAYSPLGFGCLTDKYVAGNSTTSRLALYPAFGARYRKPQVDPAVHAYAAIAQKYGLSLSQMALAFVRSRWFVASVIIAATTLDQLADNIRSAQITLSEEILHEIDAVHERSPNPAP